MRATILTVLVLSALHLCADTTAPYGVCAHVTRSQEFPTRLEAFKLMRAAGVRWVRSDFDWSYVQPNADTWRFDNFDTLLEDASRAEIQILPILAYSASFAKPAHEHLPQWRAYVRALVERYQSRLPVWEVWNEQNLPSFWHEPEPEDYLKLLRATHETIKAINPELKVMVGGYAGVPTNYIDRLYSAGGKPFFDIMNVHPYSHPAMPEGRLERELDDLRAIMAKHGDSAKPIWITELGWPTQKHLSQAPGLLKCGLETAKPGKKDAWRVIVFDDPSFSRTAAPSDALLLPELPANTRLQRLPLDALLATIENYPVDAVILPYNEAIPATGFERLHAYVRQGGVLVEFGGAPFYYKNVRQADGSWQEDPNYRMPDLRCSLDAWWLNKGRAPREMVVKPIGPAAKVPAPSQGFNATRYLLPGKLQDKDSFIPLLTGVHNGYTGTAAAVVSYNSDLKGALVISTLPEPGYRGSTEAQQALAVTRSMLIALQQGIERFFWYEFQAPETVELDQESHFGLVHKDFAPKPAYQAYKNLTTMRPVGSVVLERAWKSDDGALYFPQWRRPDGATAGALWSHEKKGFHKLTFSNTQIKLSTNDGTPLDTAWIDAGATCIVTLSDEPLYFSGGTLEKIEPAAHDAATLHALVPEALNAAARQYRGMLARMEGTTDEFPRRWEGGKLVTIGPREWTSGFFPGSLWLLHAHTGHEEWKKAALHYTAMLEQIRHFKGNHDIGFMLYCSFGNGLRLANPDGYREVLLDGAAALCTRYMPGLGLIKSWDNKRYANAVIIDNMMNLELLMWAARESGDKRFSEIAISHADQTNLRHFRPDGSAWHIIDYNSQSGKIFGYHAGQGASADAPWARGQSWGLYGYTMMYRETRKPEYLERAIKLADFLIGHRNLPADKVPYWDYEAAEIPHAPRDSSAAAIMASALLELGGFVEPPKAAHYRDIAIHQLLSLSSPAYRAAVGDNGNFILMHGVGHLPGNSEIDVPLNYGDYYYLEALLRFKGLEPGNSPLPQVD